MGVFDGIKKMFRGEEVVELKEEVKTSPKPLTLNDLHKQAVGVRDELLAEIAPLEKQEAELRAKIVPLEAELRKVREEIVRREKGGLIEARKVVSALAPKVKTLVAEPGSFSLKRK